MIEQFLLGRSVIRILCLFSMLPGGAQAQQRMSAADLARLPSPPADVEIFYGEDPLQFGELRLPKGEGPFPVAVVIHGGCWLAEYDIRHIRSLAAALTEEGMATWTLEYRRVGNPGGGWPGTFLDVARGTDHLRVLAQLYPLDLDRVITIGHSAGGQLALWLAGRSTISEDSPLFSGAPLPLKGVLGLAAAADLEVVQGNLSCDGVVDKLLGGSPSEVPDRYLQVSPAQMPPLAVKQVLLNGFHDTYWGKVAEAYYQAALEKKDPVRLVVAPNSGHFEMIVPHSSTWPLVRDAALSLLRDVEQE